MPDSGGRAFIRAAALSVIVLLHVGPAGARAQGTTPNRFFVKLASRASITRQDARASFAGTTLEVKSARWSVRSVEPLLQDAAALRKSGEPDVARIVRVTVARAGDLRAAMDDFASDPAVEYVEAEHILRVDFVPNDSAYASQWGLRRIGMEQAWDVTRGAATVTIGVIDTGIDWAHPDLRAQLRVNPAEDANHNGTYEPWPATETRNGVTGDFDGIDNDGNGFVDDVVGYDFVDESSPANASGGDYRDPDPDVTDEMGHGTSVSGIIAAATDNRIGVAGVAPGCRLMVLRAFDARGFGSEGDVARALAYAVANGAVVVNMSFGDTQYSRVLRDMVRYAAGRGVTMVASAGNSSTPELHYPSAYGETISVSATSFLQGIDGLAGFSSYGSTVDIAAPGMDIVTTQLGGLYGSFNGTSAAAPFISGVAALILSLHPEYGPDDVRGTLTASALDLGAPGWDDRFGAGLVDAARALALEHPSYVKILSPRTDFGTNGASVSIVGTAASPVMTSWALQYGRGVDPSRWTPITARTTGQAVAETLAVWDVSTLPDTSYTIRLVAYSDKGTTLEDRVVVTVDHSPPEILGVGFVPAIEGRSYGVALGLVTDEPTLARAWFREQGSTDPWTSVVLDNGAVNTLFIGRTHSAFLGDQALLPGRSYEMYLGATNAVELESIAKNGAAYFTVTIPAPISDLGLRRKPYALPPARLYPQTADFTSNGRPELLCNEYAAGGRFSIFEFAGGAFSRIAGDAQGQRIPRGIGDLTGGGRTDLLASFVRNGYVYEPSAPGVPPDRLVWADSSGSFWPITIADVNNDGIQEMLAVVNDSTIGVFTLSAAHIPTRIGTITNPTHPDPVTHTNVFSSPRVAIGDFNRNGRTDLLFGDADGDLFIVESRGGGQFMPIWIGESDYTDAGAFVTAGDFDGDGAQEFAFGMRTAPDDVIPFWVFAIYRLDSKNTATALWSQQFYGIEESSQYGTFTRISTSCTAANIDEDPEQELIISTFPELYIIDYDHSQQAFAPRWFLPLVNTDAAVVADFDGNGIAEFGVAAPDSIRFFERDLPYAGPPPPRGIEVAYVTPTQVRISWSVGDAAPEYRLYRGSSAQTLQPFGQFTSTSGTDFSILPDSTYIYAVSGYDSTRVPRESPPVLSRVLHPHAQPAIDSTAYLQNGQVSVHVTQDMGTVIPPLSSILLNDATAPRSIAILNARTLLLTFDAIPDGAYGLRVRGLRDGEGIPFDEQAFATFTAVNTARPPCFIDRVAYVPPRSFDVFFSLPVDSATAGRAANYTVDGVGAAVSATLDATDPRHVRITMGGGPIGALGKEYALAVKNLFCAGGIPISTGPGSTAGVVLNRQTLDDLFVFPNPWRETDGQDFITFANLTPRATIRIYTISGLFIRQVDETDGNGGVEWHLDDDSGRRVPGGVYLYYATGVDSQGKAVEPKTGKFAIAR